MLYEDFSIVDTARRLGIAIDERTLGRSEVEAYCPFCVGSSNHLFLHVATNQWYCQKCKSSGNSVVLYAMVRGISNKKAYEEMKQEKIYVFPRGHLPQVREKGTLAPLEQRHKVYTALLKLLPLSTPHLLNLIGRGLSMDRIEQNEYGSMISDWRLRNELARYLAQKYDLTGVPGFFTDRENGDWCLWGTAGILLPYRTKDGLIQGLQIRLDRAKRGKCRWVSSNPEKKNPDGQPVWPNGTAARSWVHITGNTSSDEARITEGGLKGDVASAIDHDALYLCVPGVNSTKYLPEAIRSLSIKRIYGEFDMDQVKENQYSKSLVSLQAQIKAIHIPFQLNRWNPEYNGTDDYKQHCRHESMILSGQMAA